MNWFRTYLASSIGKKQLLALTGLGMVGFLVAHLAGNLLIFLGPQKFNEYSHALVTNPLIYLAEAGLVAIFLAHVGLALKLTLENRAARPQGYAVVKSRGGKSRRSLASQTMIYSGLLVAVFLVLHLLMFKFGEWRVTTHGGKTAEMRDIWIVVVTCFKSPAYVAWYLACMAVLGLHLHHAVASVFETFGLHHASYTPLIRTGGKLLAWGIALGFAAIPPLVLLFVKLPGA